MRKYGKSSLSSSMPVQPGQFSDFISDSNPNAPSNENANPRTFNDTIADQISASFDSGLDRRRIVKPKKVALDSAIAVGHRDDIAFLLSKAKAEDPHLPLLGLCKISFLLPKEWRYAEQARCRAWLIDQLGFEERLYGNEPAYVHTVTKPKEIIASILKGTNAAASTFRGLTLEIPSAGEDALLPRSRPSSLTISRAPSCDSLGRGGSQKRQIHAVFRDKHDSDSDETGKESPAIMPNQGAFSPKTCRTSRMAASPHFNHSANSMRSPRAIASPADVIPGFDRVKIGDSQEDLPRLTRSRNNSYTNAGARSRGNSDGDTMTASSSAKSRAGSVDYGRSSSRLSAPIIVEESKEEMDREDEEDLEIVAAFPGPFGSKSSNGSNGMNNSSTVVMQMDQECPMDDGEAPTMDADDDDNDVRSPEPVCPQPLVTHSPTLPGLGQGQIQRQGSSHRLGYQSLHASEDAAVLSDAPTECDSDEDSNDNHHDYHPMGIAGAAAAPPAAPASHTSPIASIPSFGLSVTSHMGRQLPPLPASLHVPEQHELSRSGPLYQAPLRDASSSPTHLQPTGAVDASATALHFPRSRAEPPVMERGKKSDRDFRRSNTAPVYPTVASPSATIPTLGVTTTALLTYHTPQPVRAYSDAVENYAWEVSKAANSGITKSMRAHVDKEIGRVGVPKERPPLLRAVSESEVGLRERERERSSPRNRNPSYVPLYESYRCSGRDSVGSMISNDGGASFMHSLVNDRRTSSDFLAGMIDDQDSVSVGHTTFSAAREMVRSRLSGASMLSDAASPQMALDPYSPVANRHSSPGNFGIASGSGFHVPRESLQMHHRMHSAHAHVQDTSSARKNKKLFNSKAKQRRMSMAPQLHATTHAHHHMQSIAETSFSDDFFSPAAKPKCLSGVKSRNRRQSSMLSTKQSSSDLMTTEQSFHSHHSGNDCELSFDSDIGDGEGDGNGNANDMHYFTATTCLNELNFKGAVIGGVYQHCFDKASPVVAAPTGADKRVIDVTIEDDNSLVLSLYLPRQKTTQRIDLGSKWQWIRCSPTGYLAFSSAILPHQPVVCYFLPKHPDDWSKQQQSQQQQLAAAAPSGAARNRRVSIVPQHEYNPRASLSFASPSARQHTNSLDMEVDFMSVDGITGCPAIEEEGDGDDDAGAVQMHYADDLNISCISDPADDKLSAHFAALEIALEKGPMAASSEHRSNPALIALILEFLIEDTALFGAATAGKKPTAVATANNNEPIRRRSQRKDSATEKTVVATPAELAMLQLQACQSVCKTWALAAYMVIAKRKSSLDTAEQLCFDYPRFSRFANKFQDGRYLSQGVCKDVYCVVNPSTSNLEAVSVMDVDDLLERGMDVAITQELQISLLCSSLVNLKICPNLVQVYSLFQAGFNAPVRLWDGKKSIGDLRNLALSGGSVGGGVVRSSSRQGAGLRKCDLSAGRYQYIRMEFCSGGDVEERIRAIDQADIRAVQAMFFQMCFSMYAGREKLSLRHFDIKLLNFFVTTKDILHQNQQDAQLKQTQNHHTTSTTNLLVGMGQHVYGIPLQPGELSLIKLADFGTSAVGAKGLGDPITIQQFTTLENSPPEFLLLGSGARQSYAADTFPLGLCLFHLLTGYAPYEELLQDVHCPGHLATVLRDIWLTDDVNSPFHLIHQVVISLDMSDGSGFDNAVGEEPENVLLDTLYRYMVLFGLSESFTGDASSCSAYAGSPVWLALFDALDITSLHGRFLHKDTGRMQPQLQRFHPSHARRGRGNSVKDECAMQYLRDVQLWSTHIGNHPTMASFRHRLEALGSGADELLESLLHFDPARRCTMYDALQHPVFASLRQPIHTVNAAANAVPYMHYYRGGDGGGVDAGEEDALPIL